MKQIQIIILALIFSIQFVNAQQPAATLEQGEEVYEGGDGRLKLVSTLDGDQDLVMDGFDIQTKISPDTLCGALYIQDSGGNLHLVGGGGLLTIGGDAQFDENVVIDDTLSFENGAQTYPSSEIAFGTIAKDGNISSGSGNYACAYDAVSKSYNVNFNSYDYAAFSYTTVVTPIPTVGNVPRTGVFATATSNSDNLRIYISNLDGDLVQSAFQFVTHLHVDPVEATNDDGCENGFDLEFKQAEISGSQEIRSKRKTIRKSR